MTSTELIDKAKQRHKDLERKDYAWFSFYNGFLEGYSVGFNEVHKDIIKLIIYTDLLLQHEKEKLSAVGIAQMIMWDQEDLLGQLKEKYLTSQKNK